MGFFSPLWLLLGLAVSVPVLLHLLHRVQGRRVVFPAMRYLRRAEKENARRIRLRQWLLLALRAALILLLAVAAARPLARRGGSAHPPTDIVIVLDNSMSSGRVVADRTVLDGLKARALDALARAGAEDRFWLIRAGSPWDAAVPGDAASTAARVRATSVSATAADLAAALARADALLAAQPAARPREIHVLSDLQRSSVTAVSTRADDAAQVVVLGAAEDVWRGAAITDLQLNGGVAPRARARFDIAVATAAYEDAPERMPVRIVIDGRVSALGSTAPGSAVLLQLPPRPPGFLSGWAETEPDALRADDRRYFAVSVRPAPLVSLGAPADFVDDALATLAAAGRITPATGGAAEVVIAPDGAGADALLGGASAIVLPPDDAVRLPALNRRLAAAGIPWRYEPVAAAGRMTVAAARDDDELARALRDARVVKQYRLTRAGTGADSILLRTSDGAAWAIAGSAANGGRYVLFASSFSESAGSLATSAALVPLIDRAIGGWASEGQSRASAEPGQLLTLPAGARIVRPDSVRDTPSGTVYRVPPIAGIYSVFQDDALDMVFAVNPPAAESDSHTLESRAVRERIGGTIAFADDAASWRREIYRQRAGHEVWRIFVFAALLALIAEGWLAASGRSRISTTETAAAGHHPAAANNR